jgi:hypothetical protein
MSPCVFVSEPSALLARRDALANAIRRASSRALGNSRDVVVRPFGEAVRVRPAPPTFAWSGTGLRDVSGDVRREIESLIVTELSRALVSTGLVPVARSRSARPLSEPAAEPFADERHDGNARQYRIPSYAPPGGEVTIDLRTGVITNAPPIDWDDVTKRLRHPNVTVRAWAFYSIASLVEDGDEQAFRIAVWAIRPDDDDPTAAIFVSLRALASKKPKRFRELLQTVRKQYRSLIQARFERRPGVVMIVPAIGSTVDTVGAALHILGALVRVANEIPAGTSCRAGMGS